MGAWPVKRLDEIFEIARGGSPRPIDNFITDDPDGVNWIMISDTTVGSKFISQTKKKILPSGVSRSRLVKAGDFLLTNSMSFGRPYILNTHGCIHDGWLVLSPKVSDFHSDYFYHLLGSPAIFAEFERLAAGAVVKNLNIDLVSGVKVPLPPLEEQKRIAAILNEADDIRRKRQHAIDRLNQLGQAIFYEMFGDPNNPPDTLDARPLGEVTICLDSQRRPVKANERAAGNVPYYGANGQQGWIDRPLFNESLVLVAEDGGHFEAPERGVAYRIDGPSWVNNHAHILQAKDNVLTTEYLHRSLRHYDFMRKISGSTRSKLTKAQLVQCKIAVPPFMEQLKFDERMAGLHHIEKEQTANLTRTQDLFSSLQHRAFTGQL